MSSSGHGDRRKEEPIMDTSQHEHRPYWRRAHHSWIFWIGLVLTMVAIIIYFASDNLSLMVQGRVHRTQSSVVGK